MQIKIFIQAIIVVMLGILGSLVSWQFILKSQASLVQVVNKENKIYIEENTALIEAVKNVKTSVFGVKSLSQGNLISGSGMVITSDGLIVTLAENIPLKSESNIFINGEEGSGYQVLKRDLESNLALIKVEKGSLSPREFSDSSNLNSGLRIFVVSELYDQEKKSFYLSVNEGIVKSFDGEMIKTDILEKGMVGGSPAFDINGKFIGIAIKDSDGFLNIISVSKIKSFVGI